jgi:acetyl esterase
MAPLEAARRMREAYPIKIGHLAAESGTSLSIEDHQIDTSAGPLNVRIYRPSGIPRGVSLNLHGGGWVTGSVHVDHERMLTLVGLSNFVVVSVEYRLAPEHPFPAPLDDCYAALEWTAANAIRFGVKSSGVAIVGASSGANLAVGTTLMARDRGMRSVARLILFYPVLDPSMRSPSIDTYREGPPSRDLLTWFWEQYLPKAEGQNSYAAPLLERDFTGFPPVLVVTAELDPLKDEGAIFAQRMRDACVDARHVRYGGMQHGFLALLPDEPASRAALAEAASFLNCN